MRDSYSMRLAWDAVTRAPDSGLALLAGRDDVWSRWASATCVLATGDYSRAFLILQPLSRRSVETYPAQDEDTEEVAGLATATLASGLRQLNDHQRALLLDEVVAQSTGPARTDSAIGLAADHVGLGDVAAASTCLAAAENTLVDWRDGVRYRWVATEIGLLRNDPVTAVSVAEQALALALDHGSPRHVVKSQLFLGVAQESRRSGDGEPLLRNVVDSAAGLQLRPLLWPAVQVLSDRAKPGERQKAAEAIDFITERLPHGVGARWSGTSYRKTFGH